MLCYYCCLARGWRALQPCAGRAVMGGSPCATASAFTLPVCAARPRAVLRPAAASCIRGEVGGAGGAGSHGHNQVGSCREAVPATGRHRCPHVWPWHGSCIHSLQHPGVRGLARMHTPPSCPCPASRSRPAATARCPGSWTTRRATTSCSGALLQLHAPALSPHEAAAASRLHVCPSPFVHGRSP